MQVYVQKSTSTTLPRSAFASSGAVLIQPVAPSSGGMVRARNAGTLGEDATGAVPSPSHAAPETARAEPATREANNACVFFMMPRASHHSPCALSIARRYRPSVGGTINHVQASPIRRTLGVLFHRSWYRHA